MKIDNDKRRAEKFAGKSFAYVTECIGGQWHVCVNTYAGMTSYNEAYGCLPNPEQVMKTCATEAEAIAFAKSLNPSEIKVEKGGVPFYLECAANGWTLD